MIGDIKSELVRNWSDIKREIVRNWSEIKTQRDKGKEMAKEVNEKVLELAFFLPHQWADGTWDQHRQLFCLLSVWWVEQKSHDIH